MPIDINSLCRVRKIVVHANCPDGTASAMILHDALPDAEIVAVQYNPERDALEPEPGLLFCDMTPPDSDTPHSGGVGRLVEFLNAGAIVLDHHKTQRYITETFSANGQGVYADNDADFEPGVSGAVLAYREVWRPLVPAPRYLIERVESFSALAGIRDTWQTEHPRWRDACAQAEVLQLYDLNCWLDDGQLPYLETADQDLGMTLLDKKLARARGIAEKGCVQVRNVALFNADGRVVSDVAESYRQLGRDYNAEIVAGFFYTVNNGQMSLVFSLRSGPEGPDVSAIAKANGGGGHAHAAGFTLTPAPDLGPVATFRRLMGW